MTARRPSTMHTMQPLRPELFAIAPYPPWANPWPEQPGSRVLMLGATHQVRLHDLPMDPSLTLADLWDLAQRFPRPAHRNAVRSTRTLNEEIQDLDALRVGQCLSRPVEWGPEGPGYGQALHNVLRRLGTPETAEDLGPVLENQELILAMLLTQGCRPTIVNLAAAACSGNPRLVQRLLRANPDLRQTLGRPAPNVQKSPQGQLATFNDWSTVSETLNTLTLVQAEHARVEARLLRNDLDRLGIEPGMRDRRRL